MKSAHLLVVSSAMALSLSGCASMPSLNRTATPGGQNEQHAAAAPSPRSSFFNRFRLSRLWEPEPQPTEARVTPSARTPDPVVLSAPEARELTLPRPQAEDEDDERNERD